MALLAAQWQVHHPNLTTAGFAKASRPASQQDRPSPTRSATRRRRSPPPGSCSRPRSARYIYGDYATKETGFGMGIGIMFASLVISTLLVPALTALIGKRAWWRSHTARDPAPKQRKPLRELKPVAHSE